MHNPYSSLCLDCWHWQGLRIRCALLPDDPRLFDLHEAQGRQLVAQGRLDAWRMWWHLAQLLLDSAADPALPWHWRSQCLDRAWRPLYALQVLASDRRRLLRLDALRSRLAHLRLAPSLSYDESAEGPSHA
ncbi:FagA protein [Ectopseudomonas khazarica]|uniref:FagA protein n=1 Tax=Ectopseudomonas khazarica TaxID=2502979 RepID=A0ABW7ME28_9GAMM